MREEKSRRSHSRASLDINVTPLIDILLVLLIIFMVITPPKPYRLESKIPQQPSSKQSRPKPLVSLVTVSTDSLGVISGIRFNHEPVAADELESRLRDRFSQLPPDRRTVFIKAPGHAIYGDVVRIVDRVKSVGASPIGLQIDDLPES